MAYAIPDDNTQGRAFISVILVFFVISLFSTAVRFYSRRLRKLSLDFSDYACFLGEFINIGLVAMIWMDFATGWGEPLADFTLADARFAAKSFIAIDIIWNAATVSIRISMLLFYIRIFTVRPFQLICQAVMVVNVLNLISIILSVCLICKPYSYSFDKSIPGGHCGSLTNFELYTAIFNLLADLVIVLLPMPMLWRLQMQTKRKVGIGLIFAMGFIICILTLTRVLMSQYYDKDDYTKSAAVTALITGLEPIIGVINACLPFVPLVVKEVSETRIYKRMQSIGGSSSKIDTVGSSILRNNRMRDFEVLPDSDILMQSKPARVPDIEMDPVGNQSFNNTFVGTASDDVQREGKQIMVRQDISVESEMYGVPK